MTLKMLTEPLFHTCSVSLIYAFTHECHNISDHQATARDFAQVLNSFRPIIRLVLVNLSTISGLFLVSLAIKTNFLAASTSLSTYRVVARLKSLHCCPRMGPT
jgi:hypothetical protein